MMMMTNAVKVTVKVFNLSVKKVGDATHLTNSGYVQGARDREPSWTGLSYL